MQSYFNCPSIKKLFITQQTRNNRVDQEKNNKLQKIAINIKCVYSQGSRGDSMYVDDSKSSAMAESLTSHQYKSYIVSMVHKIRTNTEVQLGM